MQELMMCNGFFFLASSRGEEALNFFVKISIVLITRVSIDMTLYVVICNSDCYMTEQF